MYLAHSGEFMLINLEKLKDKQKNECQNPIYGKTRCGGKDNK